MRIARYTRLIAMFLRISIQNETAYRAEFFGRVILAAMQLGGEMLMLWTIFSNTHSLAGWGPWQVVVLLGVFRTVMGLVGMLVAPNMRLIMEDIRQGTLDFVLTKPINAQFYASFRQFMIWRATDVLLGLGLALVGAVKLAAGLPMAKLVLFVAMLACGAIIIYSFWLVLATSVFWFTRIDNIEMVFWNVFEAGRYPVDIYRPWVQWLLTYVIPLAFLITFPAGVLVEKSGPGALLVALPAAAVSLALASAFWRFGLRRYSGASA